MFKLFKQKNKVKCPKCGRTVAEDTVYCLCGQAISDKGWVKIQFKPTEKKDQPVTISVDGKTVWSGETRDFAELHFFAPTVIWIKYSSSVGGVAGGGFCEALIDPDKSKKWVAAAIPGQWPKLSLKPVDDFIFD